MESDKNQQAYLSWSDLRQHALWWIGSLGRSFQFFLRVAFRHWKLSFSLMALFSLFFIGILSLKSRSYQMVTTYVYGELHPKIFGDMLEKLNMLLDFGQVEKASELLKLSPEQAAKIQSIKATDVKGKPLVKNYAFRKEPMVVTVNLSDTMDDDSLKQAISYYLNSNPFTAERLDLKIRLTREEIDFINFKLQTIDSVLTNLYARSDGAKIREGAVTIENSEGKNAYELLRISQEMLQQKGELESRLATPENVISIDNSLVLPKAQISLGALIKYGLAGGIAGFLLACIWVFWRNYLLPLLVDN